MSHAVAFSFVVFGFLLVAPAQASRAFFNPNRHLRSDNRTAKPIVPWNGDYHCEQCLPETTAPETCWNYTLQIVRDDNVFFAKLERSGPGDARHWRSRVEISGSATTALPGMAAVERASLFYQRGTTNDPRSTLEADALLGILHRQGDEFFFQFETLPSKVPGQSSITCDRVNGKAAP